MRKSLKPPVRKPKVSPFIHPACYKCARKKLFGLAKYAHEKTLYTEPTYTSSGQTTGWRMRADAPPIVPILHFDVCKCCFCGRRFHRRTGYPYQYVAPQPHFDNIHDAVVGFRDSDGCLHHPKRRPKLPAIYETP